MQVRRTGKRKDRTQKQKSAGTHPAFLPHVLLALLNKPWFARA
jgi:hypothetical protein